jgi:tRNA(Ile)-lysidine synthetase-like protein
LDPLHDYLVTVRRFAKDERLLRRVTRVLMATSGGADSLATLLLLQRLGAEQGFEVVACHFDHKLRAGSADEQRRVRAMVEGLGASCVTGEGDVAAMAADLRLGLEEAARRMRYQFLAFAAGKERADVVATGHTADDQAETVLHHIVRGSGVRGVRGMLPRSAVPGAAAQVLEREAGGQKLTFDVNRTRLRNLDRAMKSGKGEVRFGETVAEVSVGQVRVGPLLSPGARIEPVVLNVPGSTRAGHYRIDAATEERPGWAPLVAPAGVLRVRTARPGDRLRRADRDVRLARALADAKVPAWERGDLLVVADGDVVVALPGLSAPLVPAPQEPELWIQASKLGAPQV